MSSCRSGRAVLKRMVMWRGGGAGGSRRADGLRGRRGRRSRGGFVGEEADDDEELPPPFFLLPFMVLRVGMTSEVTYRVE
jgi:hypothetical protein